MKSLSVWFISSNKSVRLILQIKNAEDQTGWRYKWYIFTVTVTYINLRHQRPNNKFIPCGEKQTSQALFPEGLCPDSLKTHFVMSSANLPPCRGLGYLSITEKCSKLSKGLHNCWEAGVWMDRRRECLHAVRCQAKNPPNDSERLQFPVPSWQDQEGWALSRKIKLSSCRDFNEMKFLTGVLTLRSLRSCKLAVAFHSSSCHPV